MNQNVTISNRLKRIASYLPIHSHFADIGSDHAYLPCFVCLNDPHARAIAGEVVEGPYNSAQSTVSAFQLENAVDVRLGDGLAVLHQNEVKQVVIAGMGGSLIKTILENGKDKLGIVERIIAQPNVDAKAVRKWLHINSFGIVKEEIIEENGHFYEIVVADKMDSIQHLSEQAYMFGPILLKNKTDAFYKKWKSEQAKIEFIMQQLEQASKPQSNKLNRFNKELAWIKEVIEDEKQTDE